VPNPILELIREWIAKAENDRKNAAHTLKPVDCPTDTVCFHAQQSSRSK
jgi:HEPN domain-containing protein